MKKYVLLLLCCLPFTAVSQEVKKAWSGDSELSYIQKSGNTVSSALLAKQTLVYDVRPWRNTLKIEAANVSSETTDAVTGLKDTERTSERYYISEQIDRFITEKSYAFLRATYERDRFGGIDTQITSVIGYGRTLFDTEVFDMKTEVGYGRSSQKVDECNSTSTFCSLKTDTSQLIYASENLAWQMSKMAELGQDLSIEHTEDNIVGRFGVYAKSELISSIAMKVGYFLKYTDEVPRTKKHTDEELTVSLVYSF